MDMTELQIAKSLSDEDMEAVIEDCLTKGIIRRCDRCCGYYHEAGITTKWVGDECYYVCEHCK